MARNIDTNAVSSGNGCLVCHSIAFDITQAVFQVAGLPLRSHTAFWQLMKGHLICEPWLLHLLLAAPVTVSAQLLAPYFECLLDDTLTQSTVNEWGVHE